MERFKRILYRLLFPGLTVVLISVIVAAALLIETFVFAGEDSPIAYPAYVFSAYALTIACVWIAKNAKGTKAGLDSAIHNIPFAHRYLSDISFQLHISLYLSLGLNVLYAVMKFVYGVWYHSVWFGTLAVYYFFLAVMRFGLLRHINSHHNTRRLFYERTTVQRRKRPHLLTRRSKMPWLAATKRWRIPLSAAIRKWKTLLSTPS